MTVRVIGTCSREGLVILILMSLLDSSLAFSSTDAFLKIGKRNEPVSLNKASLLTSTTLQVNGLPGTSYELNLTVTSC